MHISRFHDLDLPIHEPDTEVLSGEAALRHRGNNPDPEVDHFIRLTRLDAPGYYSLKSCLTAAEEEFNRIGELTGTRPLEPVWGLFKIPYLDALVRTSSEAALLPFGTVLVAEVPSLHLETTIESHQQPFNQPDIVNGVSAYLRLREGRLSDVAIKQFALGTEPGCDTPEYRFVDIEPRLKRQNCFQLFKNILRT